MRTLYIVCRDESEYPLFQKLEKKFTNRRMLPFPTSNVLRGATILLNANLKIPCMSLSPAHV
jgi:hypothetical protein